MSTSRLRVSCTNEREGRQMNGRLALGIKFPFVMSPAPPDSQMPRHLISDAHEWINEIPTVPIYHLAKPQPRERAWKNQRGKKTLLSLTLV